MEDVTQSASSVNENLISIASLSGIDDKRFVSDLKTAWGGSGWVEVSNRLKAARTDSAESILGQRYTLHRHKLLGQLHRYVPMDSHDAACRDEIVSFVESHVDCFSRDLKIGHVTGSAWLIDGTNEHVLLTHHRKLEKWVQLGGHADGDLDVLSVAIREAQEESGLAAVQVVSREIFDLDVHSIPARNKEPTHLHYDIRFLLGVKGKPQPIVSRESHELAWFTREEVERVAMDESVRRMCRKWLRIKELASQTPPLPR